jgi:hypothetical protein
MVFYKLLLLVKSPDFEDYLFFLSLFLLDDGALELASFGAPKLGANSFGTI